MLTDTNDFKVKEDKFGNLTLKFTKHTVFEKGDNIFISTEFKARRTELLEEIKKDFDGMGFVNSAEAGQFAMHNDGYNQAIEEVINLIKNYDSKITKS